MNTYNRFIIMYVTTKILGYNYTIKMNVVLYLNKL